MNLFHLSSACLMMLSATAANAQTVARSIDLSSSDPATALPIGGTLSQQLTQLNLAPPAFNPATWKAVNRKNINTGDSFFCVEEPNPLSRSFLSSLAFLADADEVTLDNCDSAFYRWIFLLPPDAVNPVLSGMANVDDQANLYLNGTRITGVMTNPLCNPTEPLNINDPCFGQQDIAVALAGMEPTDPTGALILCWPTTDPFKAANPTLFHAGANELVFAVCGNASAADPTGVEFTATIEFELPDADSDGIPNAEDNCPFTPNTRQLNTDADSLGDVCDNCPFISNEDQADQDRDGIGDVCDCDGDLTGNGVVDAADLAELLGAWGACPIGSCAPDLNGDGEVGAEDLALLLGSWGPCA